MISDKEIIEAVRKGDNQRVLNSLYKKSLPKVKRYIMRNSGNIEDVNDIFQDAVIVLLTKIKERKFNETYEIDGFLYTVARNLWINRAKVKSRSVLTDAIPETASSDSPDLLEGLISEEKANAVNEILEAVGEPCHSLLHLAIIKEYSLAEIAEKMKYTSDKVAKTYKYRCKKRLVALVQKNTYFQQLLMQTQP